MYFLSNELHFKEPAITSRDTYTTRSVYYLFVTFDQKRWGVGEIAPLPGLSIDYSKLQDDASLSKTAMDCLKGCTGNAPITNKDMEKISPAFEFAFYTAFAHIKHGGIECTLDDIQSGRVLQMQFPPEQWVIFDTPFTRGEQGFPINGLVWMGTLDEMKARAQAKIDAGFRCIKVKIGGIRFEEELELLRYIRQQRSEEELELRLDANGAFTPEEAPEKLRRLAEFHISSIEQPIRAGQWEAMGQLVKTSPIPIALDEELIGVSSVEDREKCLRTIRPGALVFKPSLIGVSGSYRWIETLPELDRQYWFTSALESNIGLNAIAQILAHYYNECEVDDYERIVQGLGTGQLFTENIPIPLTIQDGCLYFNKR
jgi:L-alanine-DL-glutamate epimerase-like enolase superfamily enzyme